MAIGRSDVLSELRITEHRSRVIAPPPRFNVRRLPAAVLACAVLRMSSPLMHNLIQEFSGPPLSNQRTDAYGGSFENRCKPAPPSIFGARDSLAGGPFRGRCRGPEGENTTVRGRISATDWIEGGWGYSRSRLNSPRQLKELGSGPDRLLFWRQCTACKDSGRAGYQTPFAEQIRWEATS